MDNYAKDSDLGTKVHQHLSNLDIETPRDWDQTPVGPISLAAMEVNFRSIMRLLGLDLTDDSLNKTPERIARMFCYEIFYGLDYNNFPKCTTVENKMSYDEMIIVNNINTQSFCEHHFVSIDGVSHVAYIPNERVIGLSKINRVVDFFDADLRSKRGLQVRYMPHSCSYFAQRISLWLWMRSTNALKVEVFRMPTPEQ